ncbi:MAG: SH3 domain-containing protein [Lachnospiraceae bacterium]|nr:SH3 domain-containing protein [Lachnospiraceae bacterium]
MFARKKSIVLCFVIGALLCTLISCGKPDSPSAGEAMTVAPASGGESSESETEVQDIRKTSLEENTREIVKATIKSTKSDSQQNPEDSQDPEASTQAMAARIAGASVKSGAADYEAVVQNGQTENLQAEGTPTGEPAATEPVQAEVIAPELENKVVTTVVDTYLNIRQEPSEDSEIVGRLYEGSAGEVLEIAEGWTKISSGGVEGWVHNEYVVSGEAAQSFAEESLRQVATVKEEGVRVRAGASLDSPWVGMVDLNETYQVVPEELSEEEPVPEEVETPETAETPETEAPEAQETLQTPAETEGSSVEPEQTGESEAETPMALEALVGSEALVVPEAASESGETGEVPVSEQPEEMQLAQTPPTGEAALPEVELKWIKIIYDGDQEGYVCADYVTTSFVLGKAKSMEEIRAEEEAAARAAAERAAAERAERERAAAKAAAAEASASSGWVSLGEFKITAYCGGACCNGQWAGTTSSGAAPTEGRTIAVAPGLIPYGTQVRIAGIDNVYVAEDTGGFANSNPRQIDIYYSDHGHATSKGVTYREIWVKR